MRLTAEEFARQASEDEARPSIIRAAGTIDLANSSGRMIRYLFSDPSVARDNHTIQNWLTENYNRNPVFLWAHDTTLPPIGKVVELTQSNGVLAGTVEYIDADISPFADTIFRMVKDGYLNATSTSWDPLKWRLANDRARPGGIDFELVDLLEISQVPVPALPTALATARANGIDTSPIFDWAGRVLDEGGMTMIGRTELETLRREAKMPAASRAAKPPIEETINEPAVDPAVGLATQEAERISKEDFQRSIGHVGYLAYILSDLNCVEESLEWEKAYYESDTTIPDQLEAIKVTLGGILIQLVGEEVAKLIREEEGERSVAHDAASLLRSRASAAMSRGMERAGKMLSFDNAKTLSEAVEMMDRGRSMIREVLDKNDPQGEETVADAEERAVRTRKANALKLRMLTASV